MLKHTIFIFLLLGGWFVAHSQQQLSFIQHRTGSSSNPRAFHTLGNKLLFIADTKEYGSEWWVTDGTDAGTKLLKESVPGTASSLVRNLSTSFLVEVERSIVVANGLMYFLTKNALNQSELWQTDGTTEATQKIYTYEGIIEQFRATPQKDKFYVIENFTLYYVDITAKTKRRVSNPGGSITFVLPDHYLDSSAPSVLDYQLYFTYNELGEYELWRADGTAGGNQRLFAERIRLGQPLYNVFNGEVYVYNSQNDKVLIKTRGTSATTEVLIPPVNLFPVSLQERFRGMTSRISGNELQLIEFPAPQSSISNQFIVKSTTDGRTFRNVVSKTVPFGLVSAAQVTGNTLCFASQSFITALDLTTGDTTKTFITWNWAGVDNARVKKLSNNSLAYFIKSADFRGQLYLFEVPARKISPRPVFVSQLTEFNNALILSGSTTAKGNINLYGSDLTGQNVKAKGNLQQVEDNEIPQFTLGSQLYYIGDDDGAGITLNKTDGLTAGQTVKVLNNATTVLLNAPASGLMYSDGQRALFSYVDQIHNRYIWITDGTTAGTNLLGTITNAQDRPYVYSVDNQVIIWFGFTWFYKVDFSGRQLIRSSAINTVPGNRRTVALENRLLLYDEKSMTAVDANLTLTTLENRTLFTVDSTVVPLGIGARYFYLRLKSSGKLGVMTGASASEAPRELMEIPAATAMVKVADGIFIHRTEINTGKNVSFLTFIDANGQRAQEMGPFDFTALRAVQKTGNTYTMAVVTAPNRLNVALLDVSAKTIRFLKGDAADSQSPKFVMNSSELYVVGSNVWKVLPAKDSLSRLLPAKFYQNGRTFLQDKKMYTSFAEPTPETWETDSLKTQQVGNFFVTTRFTDLLGKKGFQGYIQNSSGRQNGIYVVDSPTQTTLLKALPANRIVPEQAFAGMLIFAAENDAAGNEIWLTEGTPERTRLLADLRTGTPGSDPKDFRVIGNNVLSSAFSGDQGRQLWNVTPPVLAVKTEVLPFSFYAFPNPVSETLFLHITGAEKKLIRLKISDISGRAVLEKALFSREQTEGINVSHLSAGTYIVLVTDGYRWVSKKITKY
jgi:ELWxxDGT repeat protein